MTVYLTYTISIVGYLILLGLVITVLKRKREPVGALAWIIAIIFLPYIGAIAFMLFGNNHIERPLARKRRHRHDYRSSRPRPDSPLEGLSSSDSFREWDRLSKLMIRICDLPVTGGNHVSLYYEGTSAYEAMFEEIDRARDSISLQTYILRNDEIGKEFLERLTKKAGEGVRVRLLYDAIGAHPLPRRALAPLHKAGGQSSNFLPVNILRRRFQVNLRNHRKILIVDGKTGFLGGLNIGREYIGQDPDFGFWRDTHMRIRGNAVKDLSYVFSEDWNFATGEVVSHHMVKEETPQANGQHLLQIIEGGPDQDLNAIREWYYAATARAKKRIWISTPYFIPDETMIDGLRIAAHMGVDVRLLTQGSPPDKWIPFLASRYYWEEMLEAGVRIWQYEKGMLHAKVFLVDGQLGSIGTANLDIRSLWLNFEVNCLIYSPSLIEELEVRFRKDLSDSREIDAAAFEKRSGWVMAMENGCRLFSPLL